MSGLLNNKLLEEISKSNNLYDLQSSSILPEPYDDRGFLLFYYSEPDYKESLSDIVQFIDKKMRIFYDRKLETKKVMQDSFLAKSKSLHCTCVVFYLSKNVFNDDTFLLLCRNVYRYHLPYVSINLPMDGQILSGAQLVDTLSDNIQSEDYKIIKKLFSNEITYIPYTFNILEKQNSLLQINKRPKFHFYMKDGYAVLDYIYDITETEVVVPDKVFIEDKEYVVKAIGPSAFSNCELLEHISFPDTIEYIGIDGEDAKDNHFYDESANVFMNCSKLREIVFPPNVKILASGCFTGCTSLKYLILNDNLTFCGSRNAIFDLEKQGLYDAEDYTESVLELLKLPQTVRRISKRKFITNMNGLKEIRMPNALKIVGYESRPIEENYYVEAGTDPDILRGLLRLKNVIFDSKCMYLESSYGFLSHCKNLESVELPPNVKSLSSTFEYCSSLSKVTLPSELEHICDDTFKNCISLKEIVIPYNVCFIHISAFAGCSNLTTIVMDSKKSKKLIRSAQSFYQGSLKTDEDRLRFIWNWLFVFPLLCILHPIKVIKRLTQKSFLYHTNIKVVYVKQRFKIKQFKCIESDRLGYFKYLKINNYEKIDVD